MLAFLKDTAGETDYLLRYPEECTEDVPGETSFLEAFCQSPNSAMLVCVVDGVLAGNVALQGNTRQKICHRGSLALAVRKDYWGLGIATMLMETAISLAADCDMVYLELETTWIKTSVPETCTAVWDSRRWPGFPMPTGCAAANPLPP